jgi:hypothetical protein
MDQVGPSNFLFILALVEVNDRNAVSFGKPMNRLHIFFADLIKRNRRRNRELSLPAQERAHLSYGLKPGYIRLQKDSINRATSQRHMITQQKPIVAHDNSLTPQATDRKTVFSAV